MPFAIPVPVPADIATTRPVRTTHAARRTGKISQRATSSAAVQVQPPAVFASIGGRRTEECTE
jgi:hypothetical protein